MKNKLTVFDIAWKNVKSRAYRTGVMTLFIFVLAATLFTCMVMLTSMENGIESTSKRLGADIVVVPARYYSSIENALFTGEPCTVYFDKSWVERLEEVEGVESTSSQLFLATLGAECCESLTQLIAFDEADDFVVSPWIKENTAKSMTDSEVVVGCDLGLHEGEEVTYYGVDFTVAGVLEQSGMGYDHTVFVNLDGARRIIQSESAKNFLTIQNDDFISMVNLKVKDGYDIEAVSNAIATKYEDIAVYITSKMLGNVEKDMKGFSTYCKILSVILVLLSTIAVVSIFSITINERKREFGIFILFGTSKKQLIEIIVIEAAIITVIGTLAGIFASGAVMLFFQNLISANMAIPYLELDFVGMLVILLKCILITLGMGCVSTIYSLINLGRSNGVDLLKEGE
ncbi:MAG: ABC transporter permease [Lachnospiraceae bacterium]|nr:ABC transporter permease [Lachnospiraceae bacterium]